MARQKKIKIIREFIETPFKEIKKEEGEESLEREIEGRESEEAENFESFIDSSSGRREAPVLQAAEGQEAGVEQTVTNAPATAARKEEEGGTGVYNMPEYESNYENMERQRGERQSREGQRFNIRNESEFSSSRDTLDLNQFGQRASETWAFDDRERLEREAKKYQEVRGVEATEERRMPFSRGERKRERVLK